MVNYLYDLSKVTQNHEKFATGYVIATFREMRALAKPATVPNKK